MKLKILYALIFLTALGYCNLGLYAQSSSVVSESKPVIAETTESEAIYIDLVAAITSWKFKSGDNIEWAQPSYDDSNWLEFESPAAIPDSLFDKIGWLRATFTVDSTLSLSKPLFLEYSSLGAFEFYIDGMKIVSSGKPSSIPEEEIASEDVTLVDQVVHVELKPGQTFVLAIRYSLHNKSFFKFFSIESSFSPIRLNLTIFDLNNLKLFINDEALTISSLQVASTILLMVMILHFLMFFRFRVEKGNFWIFMIAASILCFPLSYILKVSGFVPENVSAILNAIFPIFYTLPISLIPICLSRLFNIEQKKFWFFAPIIIALSTPIFQFYSSEIYLDLFAVSSVFIIVIIGLVKIIKEAVKRKVDYLWLILLSLLSYPLMYLLGIFIFDILQIESKELLDLITFLLLTMLPLGFSMYQILRLFNSHGNLEQEVKKQTIELQLANTKLESSLIDLKSTQDQLIQQEKLASLGQLTAGIAHEIKNPLNFVNNFSEVSVELLEEVKEELLAISEELSSKDRSRVNEALELLAEIEMNMTKVHEHGSRADSIVKSMLEHSKGSSGKMLPVNFNSFIKESVNLSFHGMRAGSNAINVDIDLQLDEKINEVPLVSEDFSRVIINLTNNAFDACAERSRSTMKEKGVMGNGEKYLPKLTVRTRKNADKILVEIEDNGPGIPEEIKDKILQPFFTTKKGTEGTGLGLSITNDIIKAHGGKLFIDSNQEKGSIFTILLNLKEEL
jgi:signal transduction histidine kinase